MRNLLLTLLLLISMNQAFASDEINQASSEDLAKMMQDALQNVHIPAEYQDEASKAMELLSDPELVGNAMQAMTQVTKPIEVNKAECEAISNQMSKAMQMLEHTNQVQDKTEAEDIDLNEVKKYLDPNRTETKAGIEQMRKMMSCQKMGYMNMENVIQSQ